MKNIKIVLLSFSVFFAFDSYSQKVCGTIVPGQQVQLEAVFTDSVSEIINLEKTIYLSAHIVKKQTGENGISDGAINGAIYNLNQLFETIGLTFKLLNTKIIDDYNYNTIFYGNQDNQLTNLSSVDKTINLYFIDNLYDTSGVAVCAYTSMPADHKDVMFFKKTCFNYTILAEQMGHFLNLYHTHETIFGNELVDQSNCENAGDLCCDTYADPNLEGLVSEKCDYLGTKKDTQKTYYSPSTQNFMSFTEQTCKCFYSDEQYIRMINAVLKLKKHLW